MHISEVIDFDALENYHPDGSIVSYLWNFGDGTNEIAVMPTHVYNKDGNYTVTLTITDDDASTSKNASKFVKTAEELDDVLPLFLIGAVGLSLPASANTLLYCVIMPRKSRRRT